VLPLPFPGAVLAGHFRSLGSWLLQSAGLDPCPTWALLWLHAGVILTSGRHWSAACWAPLSRCTGRNPGWLAAGIAACSALAWCWHCADVAPAGVDTSSILVLPGLVLGLCWHGASWLLILALSWFSLVPPWVSSDTHPARALALYGLYCSVGAWLLRPGLICRVKPALLWCWVSSFLVLASA
jgi:hypothetical protein